MLGRSRWPIPKPLATVLLMRSRMMCASWSPASAMGIVSSLHRVAVQPICSAPGRACALYRTWVGRALGVMGRDALGRGTADPGRRAESEQECRKESAMKANVGDWLVIKGTTTERSDQRGLITEVHSADASPPYVVRWLATGHVATVVPGPDAIVVTPEEQEAADERAQERAAHREERVNSGRLPRGGVAAHQRIGSHGLPHRSAASKNRS